VQALLTHSLLVHVMLAHIVLEEAQRQLNTTQLLVTTLFKVPLCKLNVKQELIVTQLRPHPANHVILENIALKLERLLVLHAQQDITVLWDLLIRRLARLVHTTLT
jgi:hypothetical protein